MIECGPAASVEMVHVAVLLVSPCVNVPAPALLQVSAVGPSLKATVPFGCMIPEALEVFATVAVKLTGSPKLEVGFTGFVTDTEGVAFMTVTDAGVVELAAR